MTITKSNIPGRWLSMYKAFKKNGSNYDVVLDPKMKDAYKQLDALFSEKKLTTKASTGSRSKKTELVESIEIEEKTVKED